jgi:uncharacterized protein with HEPN domain
MPRHVDLARLRHRLDHAREAIEMLGDTTPAQLDQNRMLSLALVRLVEIVGEAASQVSQPTRARHPEIPWRQITGMHNRLIHSFDFVDYDILWTTVRNDLPPLVEVLEAILPPQP